MDWDSVYNWIVLAVMITSVIAAYFVFRYIFWPVMKKLEKSAKPAITTIGKAIVHLVTQTIPYVWKWIGRLASGGASTNATADKVADSNQASLPGMPAGTSTTTSAPNPGHEEGDSLSIMRLTIGVLCTAGAIYVFAADYNLLRVAFEIVFYASGVGTASTDMVSKSAFLVMIITGFAGMMWRDAHLLRRNPADCAATSKQGLIILSSLSFINLFLSAWRALVLGGQNILIATLTGILTGLATFVVAFMASQAIQDLIFPLGQRLVKGITRTFPVIGAILMTPFVICAIVLIAAAAVILASVYAICCLPSFLNEVRALVGNFVKEVRDNYDDAKAKRQRERDTKAAKKVKDKQRKMYVAEAMKKWRSDCKIARANGEPLPPLPDLHNLDWESTELSGDSNHGPHHPSDDLVLSDLNSHVDHGSNI